MPSLNDMLGLMPGPQPQWPNPTEAMDPFQRAALRTRESVQPSRGRAYSPQQEGLLNTLVPQSPADVALMMAGSPVLKMGARALGAAAGFALQPSEADAGPIAAMRKFIRAYHGSPYDFDKFDLSKIGTGEGAQAYGHGLYFAENPKVAADYKRRLAPGSPMNVVPDSEAINKFAPEWDKLVTERRRLAGPEGRGDTSVIDAQMDNFHNLMIQDTMSRNPNLFGRMYEVNINAQPEQFLDWDKPRGAQAPAVRSALDKIIGPSSVETGEGFGLGNQLYGDVGRSVTDPTNPLWRFSNRNPDVASTLLNEAGIPGIKYLDQGSRTAGQGSSNYVLFRDDIIDIVKKYGWAGLTALTGINPDNLAPAPQQAPQMAQ